jgi:hypothetical protein
MKLQPQGPISEEDLLRWFTYQPPRPGTPALFERLREGGLALARLMQALCPPGEDRAEAIDHLRTALMWANASLACLSAEQFDDQYAGRNRPLPRVLFESPDHAE